MRLYKHRRFHQWAKSEKITDKQLRDTITEFNHGLNQGNLGGGLYKKRVAIPGKGKRGGYRVIIAIKLAEIAFFLYGFSKSDKANINEKEKFVYRTLAKSLFALNAVSLNDMIRAGKLIEVK